MREIIIDRESDTEIVIVKVKIDNIFLQENYFFDISETDENINQQVNADLTAKGYDND